MLADVCVRCSIVYASRDLIINRGPRGGFWEGLHYATSYITRTLAVRVWIVSTRWPRCRADIVLRRVSSGALPEHVMTLRAKSLKIGENIGSLALQNPAYLANGCPLAFAAR